MFYADDSCVIASSPFGVQALLNIIVLCSKYGFENDMLWCGLGGTSTLLCTVVIFIYHLYILTYLFVNVFILMHLLCIYIHVCIF